MTWPQARANTQLVIGPGTTVDDVTAWLDAHGVTRYHVTAATPDGLVRAVFQTSYRSQVHLVVPGDVLRFHLDGHRVINHGPGDPDS